ncbi:MAG: DUF2267 domain-containing protein [Chloroflexota bacterium]
MIDEIAGAVSEKTGLSEDMSKMAVELVLNMVKEKLPEPLDGYVDTVVGGGEVDMTSLVGGSSGGGLLGGLFGGKK